jgi:hypothetical protein
MKKYTILSFLLFGSVLSSNAQYISTVAGNGVGAGTGSGTYAGDGGVATAAGLFGLTSVAFDGAGNIYIADKNNNVIRKVNTLGVISTIAGTGVAGYSGDGGAAISARLNQPYGVAVDNTGTVYISDNGNNVIRKVSSAGIIFTYAGTGAAGYSGDGGAATAATLNSPQGIVLSDSGWLYIADASNNVVRVVDSAKKILTVAGTGAAGYSGNGGMATSAALHYPTSVALDVYQNIYVSDYLNNVVRKISAATGTISTVAGNGTMGAAGDGGAATAAQLHFPSGVSVDGARNLYIADQGNNVVRRVDSTGIIVNFAGTHTNGYLGDGGLALNAQLSSPKGVAADGWGRVYIADYDNNVVRVVASMAIINGVGNTPMTSFNVYPNPSSGAFSVEVPALAKATITVADATGKTIVTKEAAGTTILDLNFLPAGFYILKAEMDNATSNHKIVIAK